MLLNNFIIIQAFRPSAFQTALTHNTQHTLYACASDSANRSKNIFNNNKLRSTWNSKIRSTEILIIRLLSNWVMLIENSPLDEILYLEYVKNNYIYVFSYSTTFYSEDCMHRLCLVTIYTSTLYVFVLKK